MKIALIFFLLLTSCSTLDIQLQKKLQSKKLTVNKSWVRNTVFQEHLGFRKLNRMQTVFTDGLVVQANAIDSVVAYDRKTGHEVWRKMIKGGSEGGGVISGNRLYIGGSNSKFYALDVYTGKELWEVDVDSEVLSRPTVKDNFIYFISGNNRVYKLDSSGKTIWSQYRYDTSNISVRGGSTPWVEDNKVYVGLSNGELTVLNDKNGEVIWSKQLNNNRRFKDIDASPVIKANRIYITAYDGGTYCLDKNSGRIIWRVDEGGYSAVTLHKNQLFFATSDGQLIALDQSNGKKLWSYQLNNTYATQPSFYRGLVMFGEFEGDFVILDSLTGEKVQSYSTGRGIMSSPAVDSKTGDVYFISVNANLWAMQIAWNTKAERWPWEN